MPHNSLDPSQLLAWAGGLITAAFGAFGLWLANRLMGKAAFQQAINNGFNDLLDKVNADRVRLENELHAERVEAASERAQLRGEIINLTQVVESLKALLRANGIQVPERHHTPVVPLLILNQGPADEDPS